MRVSEIERMTGFDHRFARAQATDVVDLPWGFAVLHKEFPLSQYPNRIAVTSAAPATDVLAMAEVVLGGAGLWRNHAGAPSRRSISALCASIRRWWTLRLGADRHCERAIEA